MGTISRSGISGGGTIQSTHITNIIDALDGTSATTTVIATGSFTGSLIGTLTGTASFATNALTASYASNVPLTASYALTALSASYASNVPTTASYALAALSSSYAVTASYALNAGASSGGGFPYTGSAIVSGSLQVIGTTLLTGSVNINQSNIAHTLNGKVVGNANLILDLGELAKSGTAGYLVLPTNQPGGSPPVGTCYLSMVDPPVLLVFDGSNWRTLTFT